MSFFAAPDGDLGCFEHFDQSELSNDFDDCTYYSPSDGCSSDEDSEDEFEKNSKFTEGLAEWAGNSQTPHCNMKGLLSLLRPFHPQLPKDPRTLLQTMTKYVIDSIAGGEYYHFGVSVGLRNLFSAIISNIRDGNEMHLQINIDGLPLFRSSKTQFWPILGRVAWPFSSEPFIVGLFCGDKKPTEVDAYLQKFVSEVKDVELQHGIDIDGISDKVKVILSCFICDAPARAFVKQIKPHNAYYGCDKCIQRGTWENKVTFPEVNAQLRTDVAFDEMVQNEHHVGISPISQLSVGLVS